MNGHNKALHGMAKAYISVVIAIIGLLIRIV